MTIRGSLAEAGLPDVFQLLALGQKTGCLSVARAGELGSIYFDRGRVAFATIVNRVDKLGERLVRAGEVDEADLRAALAEQAADPSRRLGEVLLRRGIVTREAIARHVRGQVEEAVYSLFTWREGTFAFEPGATPDDPARVVSLDAGSLLMEGARRVDEWALLASSVPGPEALFAGLPALEATGALPALHARLAPLLDGQRSVSRLAEELPLIAAAGHALRGRANAAVRERVIADLRDRLGLSSFVWHRSVADSELTGERELIVSEVDGSREQMFHMNGRPFDHGRIDQLLPLGGVEEWHVASVSLNHPVHMHVNPFQIVSIRDAQNRNVADPAGPAFDPDYAGLIGQWKDTLLVKQGHRVVFRTRYERFTGDFVIHCHILLHGDMGMMQYLRIFDPADAQAAAAPTHH